jgi:hypothetical protein
MTVKVSVQVTLALMVKIFNILYKVKLHQIIFGIITVVFICTIRHIFLVQPLDLSGKIFIGIICLFSRLLFIDFLKDYLNELGLNLDLGQIFWGRHYMGGGDNNITVFKDTEIKQIDKIFMVDSNNDKKHGTQSSSSNTAQKNRRYDLRPTTSNTTQVNTQGHSTRSGPNNTIQVNRGPASTWQMNTIINRTPFISILNQPLLPLLPNNPVLPNPSSVSMNLILPDFSSRTFRTIQGNTLLISDDGQWKLNNNPQYFPYDFNYAFDIYKRLPTQEIMRDYDRLIHDLPRRNMTKLSHPSTCALKYAGSNNLLSANSKELLKGLGNDERLVLGFNYRPSSLTSEVRRHITAELIANRDKMIESLNNRAG